MATRNKKNNKSQTSHPSASLLPIILSFFIGYAIAHVFDINSVGRQLDSLMQKQAVIPDNQANSQAKKSLPKPKFEYYTLMKKDRPTKNHPPRQSNIEISEANPLQPIHKADKFYLLQLASYYKQEDADRLKAELILQGHQAFIKTYQTNDRTVYRLMLGPFKRKTDAEKEQVDLARQLNVMGVIKKTVIT